MAHGFSWLLGCLQNGDLQLYGLVIGIDRFGASAPEKALAQEYGFTPSQIADRLEAWMKGR
mgnify:CR=1 FL=1